jgi:pimeloyl-ACP methyl ester carboxylesterase
MERRSFETPLGEIWLWGEAEAFEAKTPTVMVLTGAFAPKGTLRAFPSLLPEAPVLISDLPGYVCPALIHQSVGVFCAAYSTVVQSLQRPVVICGSSLGGTVALGVRTPNLSGVVALDPPMRASALAPMWPEFRKLLRDNPDNQAIRDLLWNVFGLDETRNEERDYFPTLSRLASPTIILAGVFDDPCPSLLSQSDRLRLRAHPMIRFRTILGVGHDIGERATSRIIEGLRELIDPTNSQDDARQD